MNNSRNSYEKKIFASTLNSLRNVASGNRHASFSHVDFEGATNLDKCIMQIMSYFKLAFPKTTDAPQEFEQRLDYILHSAGVMRRNVLLKKGWYKRAVNAILAQKPNGEYLALIPGRFGGYTCYDFENKRKFHVNSRNSNDISLSAVIFYEPLAAKKLSFRDLLKFMLRQISLFEVVRIGIFTFAATLAALIIPRTSQIIYSAVIPEGDTSLLPYIATALICVAISGALILVAKELSLACVRTRLTNNVYSAFISRVLSLPVSFFKKFDTGDLASRVASVEILSSVIASSIITAGFTILFSSLYIQQIFSFAPDLVIPAVGIVMLSLLISLATTVKSTKFNKKQNLFKTKLSGVEYALFNNLQKIKLAGSERLAFVQWGNAYVPGAMHRYHPPMLMRMGTALSAVLMTLGNMVIYVIAAEENISGANFIAFTSSMGLLMGSMTALISVANAVATIIPGLEMIKPVLEAEPEKHQNKRFFTNIRGDIMFSHISFSYGEDMPLVINDLSLEIKAGQYVAIVGKTGCGKSTLMRLLLGLEIPTKGSVYIDENDLKSLDLQSFRRNVGVVLQNSSLISGTLFENIIISAPWLTQDDAWEAARLADIDTDIMRLPMRMQTVISSKGSGVSGGQKQRLMIARAIAPKPKILMLDEATSALDNISQQKVTQALNGLNCTRIIVAHRLSTIKNCDRIIYLHEGKIVEDGTYAELIAQSGYFASLIHRQQLNEDHVK